MDPRIILALVQASPELIGDAITLLQAYQTFMIKVNAVKDKLPAGIL